MKLPFLKRTPEKAPSTMSEAELIDGISRCSRRLAREKDVHMALAHATIIIGGGAAAVAAFGFGIFAPPVMLGIIALAGGGTFFGGGYTCKFIMSKALCRKHDLEDELGPRIEARQEAERLEAIENNRTAAEKFNAAIENGLPLEKSITVKRSPLRLKFPDPPGPRHGFSRLFRASDRRLS